ncbi:MAG: LptA/OstA family protein [Treponemataceae bacterium]|nr:LptA/OstA family protein [Spirochaetales bacterium]MDY6030270.1 LptA/OstA family protein [Treponemataceae bacterium]
MKKKFLIFVLTCTMFSLCMFSESITFSADRMTGSTGENSEYSKLEGNAFIKTETMEIRADEIVLSGQDFRFITATGSIVGKSSESDFDFECEQLEYDRETKLVILRGNVSLVDNENDVKATAQLIEFDQNTEIANMQITVKLIQKKNVCTGAIAVYNKKEQLLELKGSPQIQKDKDLFKANEISMNLETEKITLDGKVRGSVTDSGENSKSEEEKKGE